jgi:serine/threonine protein kinase
MEEYEIQDIITKRKSIELYTGIHKETGRSCIIKVHKQYKNLRYEKGCYSILSHPNILKRVIQRTIKRNPCLIVYCENPRSELYTFISNQGIFTESFARVIFRQLHSALKYIHSTGLIHRNLRMESILMENSTPILHGFSTNEVGISYSPEFNLFGIFTKKTDIFDLGVILFIMVCGSLPFQIADSNDWLYNKLLLRNFEMFWKVHDRTMNLSDSFKNLIEKMLEPVSMMRINLSAIEKHEWFLIPSSES